MLTTRVQTTATRYGKMAYFAGDGYIGRSLELYGEYSQAETVLMAKIIKPGWRVVNGGANIGALTVALAELVGAKGKVYAFEPQPETYQLLKRNSKSRKQILCSSYALWHSRGDSKMRLLEELTHDNFGCTYIGDDAGSYTAKMIALDDWLQGEDVELIFLDVEGCEVMALEGARQTIKRCRPLLYLEDHPERSQRTGSDLVHYVREQGYLVYSHKPDMYSPDNWKKCPENVFTEIKKVEIKPYKTLSYNVLCIPKERLDEYRTVVDDQTKYHFDSLGNKLTMIVPRSPSQVGASGWAAVVRCGGVGDNLIAASVCRPLKEQGYKVEMITQTPNDVIFQNNPFIDKISVYEAKDWPTELDKWQDWFRMRSREYSRFANFSHSCECRHALFPIQTWFWWPQEYRRKMCAGNYLETVHDIIGVPHTFGPLFFPTDEELAQAHVTKRKLGKGPIIGWCLAGTRIDKVYPYAPLLIGRLIKELDAQVVMLGAPPPHRDAEIAKIVQESVKAQNGSDSGLSHAGSPSLQDQTWPIRRILTFAAQCDLVIGPDTGPSWGVAFEPVPKIVMVSHTSVENITKHWVNTVTLHADPTRVPCWPCHRLHTTFETCCPTKVNDGEFAACISDINAESIIQTARQLLQGYIHPALTPDKPSGSKFYG
jgi:FkbM family methyltransferase